MLKPPASASTCSALRVAAGLPAARVQATSVFCADSVNASPASTSVASRVPLVDSVGPSARLRESVSVTTGRSLVPRIEISTSLDVPSRLCTWKVSTWFCPSRRAWTVGLVLSV